MDSFTVPTFTFGVLYCFLENDRPGMRRWFTGLAIFALAYVTGMSAYGHLAK